MASYRKDVNKRCLKKMEDDLQKIITPSDTSKFSTSPIARDALKVGYWEQHHKVKIHQYQEMNIQWCVTT